MGATCGVQLPMAWVLCVGFNSPWRECYMWGSAPHGVGASRGAQLPVKRLPGLPMGLSLNGVGAWATYGAQHPMA